MILACVLNIAFYREYGLYFVTMVYPFMVVGYMFSRMLLRPLWWTVNRRANR